MWGKDEELGGEGEDKKCQRREEFLCSVVSHCRESLVCYGNGNGTWGGITKK